MYEKHKKSGGGGERESFHLPSKHIEFPKH